MLDPPAAEVDECTAANVIDDVKAMLAGQAHQVFDGWLLGKSHNAVIAVVDPHDGAGLLIDGISVVAQVGLVGGANLPEHSAAGGHHIRHAESAADLDQLAPGDDHFPALSQGVEDEHGCRGIVVDHGRGLGSCQLADQVLQVVVPVGTAAGLDVRGQGAVPFGHLGQGRLRCRW